MLLIASLLLGLGLQLWRLSGELGYELSYLALVGLSLLASEALPALVGNVLFGGIWLLWPARRVHWALHGIVQVNRWIGHAEALLGWLTIAMLAVPCVAIQVPAAAGILLYGGRILDRAAGWHLNRRLGRTPRPTELQWARRPLIYVATFASLAVIFLLARSQWRALVPLTTAIVAGMVLRALAAWRQVRLDRQRGAVESEEHFRSAIVRWGRRLDGVVAVLVLGAAIAVPTLLLSRARLTIRADRADRGRLAVCEDQGPTAKPGPVTRDVSLFLVSDSQFHELAGSRTAAQLDLVDSLVPVAVRPVELDLLSEFTLLHFAEIYASMHTGDRAHMLWGHLGDFGDVGCVGELRRMTPVFAAFGRIDRLAGIARGNHDDTFVGNFDWHPDWDAACPSGRLGKTQSSAMLRDATNDVRSPSAIPLGRDHPLGLLLQPERSWRATVAPLGVTTDAGTPRAVVAIFLDTSDYDMFALGIAGLRGSLSSEQIDDVFAATTQLAARGPEYAHPLFIVLMHHPAAELDREGWGNLHRLVQALGPGVLAVVSAHTHESARRYRPLLGDGRRLPEYVLGSTIDPPQEAAVLDVGPDAAGVPTVRLETVQAVSRDGLTCAPRDYPVAQCDETIARLEGSCPDLLGDVEGPPTPDATQNVDVAMALRFYLGESKHPVFPWDVRAAQVPRAKALLACLGKVGGRAPPDDPLDDATVFPFLEALYPAHRPELACLSWAASVLQDRKHDPAGPSSFAAAAHHLDVHRPGDLVGAKVWVDSLR